MLDRTGLTERIRLALEREDILPALRYAAWRAGDFELVCLPACSALSRRYSCSAILKKDYDKGAMS